MTCPGGHAFALERALEKLGAARSELQQMIDGDDGRDGASGATPHAARQRQSLRERDANADGRVDVLVVEKMAGGYRCRVRPGIERQPPVLTINGRKRNSGLVGALGGDGVAVFFEG